MFSSLMKSEAKTSASTKAEAAAGEAVALAKAATAVVPVPSAVRRSLGLRTASSRRRRGKSDRVFSVQAEGYCRPGRILQTQVYTFQQDAFVPAFLTSSSTLEVDDAISFTLAGINNVTSFTNIFDQYRIAGLEVWLTPRITVTNTASENTGTLWSTIDYDDANSTLISYLQEYENALFGPGTLSHYRKFVPHAAVAAFSGTFTSYANVEAPWIDSVSTAVQHYGFKAGITVTDAAYVFDLTVRYTLQFRNTR